VDLNLVKIPLVFNFATGGVGDKEWESISLGVYKGGLIIGNASGPETSEPIICVFLAVSINELGFNTKD
jgi:hypothetical protein